MKSAPLNPPDRAVTRCGTTATEGVHDAWAATGGTPLWGRPRRISLPWLALLALATLSACSSRYINQVDDDGVVLARKVLPDGATLVYKLKPADAGSPRVNRFETRTVEQPNLGIGAKTIDDRLAPSLKVAPYSGVYVSQINADGPAEKGGMVSGDIVVSIDGTAVTTAEQLQAHVLQRLRTGSPTQLVVRRCKSRGDVFEFSDQGVTITPVGVTETVSTTEAIKLSSDPNVQRLTGMQVAELTPELSLEIYGSNAPITLVSGVVYGSPAYMAGLRGGDRIVSCDGVPPTSKETIREAVDARAGRDNPGVIALEVEGATLGAHAPQVEITYDLDQSSHFEIPILFEYRSQASYTKWSFLDFIFQFGANYESEYVRSSTRQPASRTELSLFPFGMFEFETSPSYSKYTMLWLIRWTSRR